MKAERWLVLGSVLLLALSLILPAVEGPGFPVQRGLDLLRQGAGLWREGIVAWYANPALGASLLLSWFGRYRLGLIIASVGLLLALSTLAVAPIMESRGRSVPEFDFAMGFYLWIGALLVAMLVAWIGKFRQSGGASA